MNLTIILQSYLFSFIFWLGITLGSLAVLLTSYVVGGHWSIPVRRIAQAAAKNIWLMALFVIPILLGVASIYPWAAGTVANDPTYQHKAIFLNIPFFIGRAIFYFAVWIALVFWANSFYKRSSHTFQGELKANNKPLAAIGIITHFIIMTFAAVDWLMSLQVDWYSTAFGLIIVTAQGLAGLSFNIIVLSYLSGRNQKLKDFTEANFGPANYYRDLGALQLVSIMLWAYVFFFQFLIIWAGNIPHEISWYIDRSNGGWNIFFVITFILNFAIPFAFLITTWAKRSRRVLTFVAWCILVANLLFYFWMIIPAFRPGQFGIQIWDFVFPIVMGVIWLAVFIFNLRGTAALEIPATLPAQHERAGHSPA